MSDILLVFSLGQPKIGYPNDTPFIKHQIAWLDIAVHDALRVRVVQRLGGFAGRVRVGSVVVRHREHVLSGKRLAVPIDGGKVLATFEPLLTAHERAAAPPVITI